MEQSQVWRLRGTARGCSPRPRPPPPGTMPRSGLPDPPGEAVRRPPYTVAVLSVGPSRAAPGCQYLHDIAQIFTLQNGFCSHFVKNRKNIIIILSISWKKEYVNINSGSADVFEIALCSTGDAGFSPLIPFSLQAWAGVCNHATIFFSILHTILLWPKRNKCIQKQTNKMLAPSVLLQRPGRGPRRRRRACSLRPPRCRILVS